MKRKIIIRQNIIQAVLTIAIIVLINVVSSFVFFRIDLTAEKRYTLSPATREYLSKLNDIVYFKVYLEGDELDAGYRKLSNSVREMLDEFINYSNDNIQYEFIDLFSIKDENTKNEVMKQLRKKGLQPVIRTNTEKNARKVQQIIFPGALISYGVNESVVDFLQKNVGSSDEENLRMSIENLEYQLVNAIRKVSVSEKKNVAFIEGHGELTSEQTGFIHGLLSEYYNVKRLKIDEQINSLRDYSAIVIAKPDSAFSEKDKFIIDQFIMKGGKVLWLIDPVKVDMDSLAYSSSTIAFIRNINLEDQLFKYGVRINPNLIQDVQCALIPVNTAVAGAEPKFAPAPWLYFPLLGSNGKSNITRNINLVKSEFISSVDTVGNLTQVKKTVLLSTSKFCKLVNAPLKINLGMINEQPDERQFNKSNLSVAVLLEGKFESVFKNRLSKEISENKEIGYKEESVDTKMIVVSDGDIIKNLYKGSGKKAMYYPTGYDRYSGETFGNKDFILNAMNYLLDDGNLLSIRSREISLRLLDKNKISDDRLQWQLLNTIIPVLFIAAFGLIINFLRKKKYTENQLS